MNRQPSLSVFFSFLIPFLSREKANRFPVSPNRPLIIRKWRLVSEKHVGGEASSKLPSHLPSALSSSITKIRSPTIKIKNPRKSIDSSRVFFFTPIRSLFTFSAVRNHRQLARLYTASSRESFKASCCYNTRPKHGKPRPDPDIIENRFLFLASENEGSIPPPLISYLSLKKIIVAIGSIFIEERGVVLL